MKRKIIFSLISGFITWSVLPNISFALDIKSYPGSMCQPYFGNSASSLRKNRGGQSKNTSNGPMWVTCPVVRDSVSRVSGRGIAGARLYGLHSTRATDDFYCEFINTGDTDQNFETNSNRWPRSFPTNVSMWFNISNTNGGAYVFLCRLPSDSSITSYRVYEYNANE